MTVNRSPRRRGPGPMPAEKAKDFKGAISRLINELKSFHVLIIIALFLAAAGSVLSILTPNILSDLTDEISKGLVVNSENVNNLMSKISYENLTEITIDDEKISVTDQIEFLNLMSSLDDTASVDLLYQKIDEMPESIKNIVEPVMNMNKIKTISITLVLMLLLSALFNFIESISMTTVSNNFAKGLRSRISKKINKLPLSYFDRNQTGDILSRVTNDVDTVAQSMNHSLATLVSAITLFVGTIIMMFVTNSIMAITAIISSLLGFIFMFSVLGKSQKYFTAKQEELGALNGHIEEIYSGLNVVKVYNGTKEADGTL